MKKEVKKKKEILMEFDPSKKMSPEEKAWGDKECLKMMMLEVITKLEPEIGVSFGMRKIAELPHTRGLLRDKFGFKPEQKRLFREILQELKQEGILYHKNQARWVRLE